MNYESYIGKSERRFDTVWPPLAHSLAATLNVTAPLGEELPPLWHWLLFQEWVLTSALGMDGHQRRGEFLPPEPSLPRRMWAGGRVQFQHPLLIGEQVSRESTIAGVEEKTGSTGRLLLVRLRHTVKNDAGTALVEEQDIIYREPQGVAIPARPNRESVTRGDSTQIEIDATLLFRYSAVTGNSHRIHYDQEYANQEGYPSLVVHGPLQATLLAAFAMRYRKSRTLAEFVFRGRQPALLHNCPLTLEACQLADAVGLRSLDREGAVCTTAEAIFRS